MNVWFVVFFTSLLVVNSSCQTASDTPHNGHAKQKSTVLHPKISSFETLVERWRLQPFTETDANTAYLLARSYLEQHDYPKAEILLELTLRSSKNSLVYLDLIHVKLILQKTSEAKEIAKQARLLHPKSPEIFISTIQIYQIEGNMLQVSTLVEKGLQLFPENESIVVLYALYKKQNAIKILENFIQKNPKSFLACQKLSLIFFEKKDFEKAIFYAKKAYAIEENDPQNILVLGALYEEKKDYKKAEYFYKNIFEKDPNDNINAQNYIRILLLQKKQQEALSVLLKIESTADEQNPVAPLFTFEMGRIFLLNRDYVQAKRRFESLLQPTSTWNGDKNQLFFLMGYTCENLGLFESALAYFQRIPPSDKEWYDLTRREIILASINQGKEKEAQDLIATFSISKEAPVEDTLFKASVFAFFKQYDTALQLLRQAQIKFPKEKELYTKEVELELRQGKNLQQSILKAEKIFKKWPKDAVICNFYGYVLAIHSPQPAKAEPFIQKALAQEPQNPYYLDSLGVVYLKTKRWEKAEHTLQRALALSPNEPVILYHYAQITKEKNNLKKYQQLVAKLKKILAKMTIYAIESDEELSAVARTLPLSPVEP